jgi:DNA-binding transcriptional ArsR family regulator
MKADLRDLARGFSLLSERKRLAILQVLTKGPANVTAICKALGLEQPAVSHHLGLLRIGRLVDGKRRGRSVIYEADKAALKALASALATE